MKRSYFLSLLSFTFLLFLLYACSTTLPPLPHYFISDEVKVFNFPQEQLWAALVLAIGDIKWQTDFLDQPSGTVKFKTSYVYTDQSNRFHRIYQWPEEYQVVWSDLSSYLKKNTCSPIRKIYGRPIFVEENLIIQIKPETPLISRVELVYQIEVYSSLLGFSRRTTVKSNGQVEAMLLSEIRRILKQDPEGQKAPEGHEAERQYMAFRLLNL